MRRGENIDPRTLAAVHIGDLERKIAQFGAFLEHQRMRPGVRVSPEDWQCLEDMKAELGYWKREHMRCSLVLEVV